MTAPGITRLLVANRGEIARRVFATCRRLGIETVAVHSDADAGLPFVREADAAVRLPGNAPSETYLRADLVLAAAAAPAPTRSTPATDSSPRTPSSPAPSSGPASPGSGRPRSRSRRWARRCGRRSSWPRPAYPCWRRPPSRPRADLPLLVKASAGGGGRGMRVVRDLAALEGEMAAAAAEAESAFGDARCSSSRTSSAAGTSRSRWSATPTGTCSCSGSATARSSGATRRWSRRRPRPTSIAGVAGDAHRRPQGRRGDRVRRCRHRGVPLRPGPASDSSSWR